jgi:acetyl esterase/lipase
MRPLGRRAFSRRFVIGGLLPAAGASALSGCSPARLLNALVPGDYRLIGDQAYGDGPRRRLDIYLPPEGSAPGPVVVFIYGGDWRDGDKATYRFVGEALASRGFVTAIPDYRLYPNVRFPDFLDDCAAAVAWVRRNAREVGADPGRLCLAGHSAGAYNAAMLMLDGRRLGAVGLDARRDVRGAALLAGPYDFLPFDGDTGPIFGAADDPASTQPVNFVDGREPPMLLAAGLDDATVRPRNTTTLAGLIRQRGGRAEVKLYPGIGHVGLVAALAAPLRFVAPVLEDSVRFLTAVTQRTGP